jgi:hypothetical protein
MKQVQEMMSNQRYIESTKSEVAVAPLTGVDLVVSVRDSIKRTDDRADLIEAAKAKLVNGVHPASGLQIADAIIADLS